ncbi:hypothetical protein ED733_004227 [Metarhizium rileyi]|uniref:Uncharacterized protein n=1 Tax=Metarhizium rileyi (strain RCEF 4871) TaxID=1649241 RepID=A0A5C6GBI0_METRR|nr:hypothetical protein ED733_004227 [Metarhizium rileyi]
MVARFHRVSFAIDLARTGERERPTKKKAKVTKSTRAASSRGLGGLKLAGNIEFDCLESDDQKAVDEFIVRMNLDTAQREAPRRPKRRSRHTVANEMIYATCTKDMLEICLQNIMVGIKQCPRYMTFVDKSPGKPLSLLAPAVFNMPYLKDISDRKDFLFTIATSLGRMRTAESPSLRRKVEELEAATSKHIEDGSSVKGYYEQGSVQDDAKGLLSSRSTSGIVPGSLLLLLLLRLQSGVVNVPEQQALQSQANQYEQQVQEEARLVVEDRDGFFGGADPSEPVEVGHVSLFPLVFPTWIDAGGRGRRHCA